MRSRAWIRSYEFSIPLGSGKHTTDLKTAARRFCGSRFVPDHSVPFEEPLPLFGECGYPASGPASVTYVEGADEVFLRLRQAERKYVKTLWDALAELIRGHGSKVRVEHGTIGQGRRSRLPRGSHLPDTCTPQTVTYIVRRPWRLPGVKVRVTWSVDHHDGTMLTSDHRGPSASDKGLPRRAVARRRILARSSEAQRRCQALIKAANDAYRPVYEEIRRLVEAAAAEEREREAQRRRQAEEAGALQKRKRELRNACFRVASQTVWGFHVSQKEKEPVAYAFRRDVPAQTPPPAATDITSSPGAEVIPDRALDAHELEEHLIRLRETGDVDQVVWDRRAQSKVRLDCGVSFAEWWNTVTTHVWNAVTIIPPRQPRVPPASGRRRHVRIGVSTDGGAANVMGPRDSESLDGGSYDGGSYDGGGSVGGGFSVPSA